MTKDADRDVAAMRQMTVGELRARFVELFGEPPRSRHTRARVTQITNLTLLAPDIQEALLFLPRMHHGPDPITERDLRPIIARPDWQKQRQIWRRLRGTL